MGQVVVVAQERGGKSGLWDPRIYAIGNSAECFHLQDTKTPRIDNTRLLRFGVFVVKIPIDFDAVLMSYCKSWEFPV